jgi:hypothetical protein
MSDLSSTEEFLLASDNHLGDLWAHRYLDGPYPEAIQDWVDARQFFLSGLCQVPGEAMPKPGPVPGS